MSRLRQSVSDYVDLMIAVRDGREGAAIDSTVYHLWHGDRVDRQYETRNKILSEFAFDPAIDCRLNDDGILEWSSDKPGMHTRIREYFEGRKEDG